MQALFDLIRRLKAQGRAIIYISHFLEEVRTICDRFSILRDGKTVATGDAPSTPPEKMVEFMVGRTVDNLYPRSPRTATPGDPILELQNLSGPLKPTGASLTLRRGEVLGVAGLIGAGRTELLRALFGLDKIQSGQVRIAAFSGQQIRLSHTSPQKMWNAGLGMLSEDRKSEGLALTMSIADNITLSDLTPFGPLGFIGPRAQRRAANRWADTLALKRRDIFQPISDLSGGNQQKCALARLLHHNADILLLDEPTRGIDVGSKADIYQLIDDLGSGRKSAGEAAKPRAILVVSSYFPELLGICDRIAVMCRGTLGEALPASQLTQQSLVLASTCQDAAARLTYQPHEFTCRRSPPPPPCRQSKPAPPPPAPPFPAGSTSSAPSSHSSASSSSSTSSLAPPSPPFSISKPSSARPPSPASPHWAPPSSSSPPASISPSAPPSHWSP